MSNSPLPKHKATKLDRTALDTTHASPIRIAERQSRSGSGIFTRSDMKRLASLLSAEALLSLRDLAHLDDLPWPLFDSAGEEIDWDGFNDISIDFWSNDHDEYVWQLGKNVFVHETVDYKCKTVLVARGIKNIQWGWLEGMTPEDWCVSFGVKPTLTKVEKGFGWATRVWIEFFTTNEYEADRIDGWARSKKWRIHRFKSYAHAKQWISQDKKKYYGMASNEHPEGHYLYRSNEFAEIKYTICEYVGAQKSKSGEWPKNRHPE